MGKVEQLIEAAVPLADEQVDGLIAYARSLLLEPVYSSAPLEAMASIERGLAQVAKGETVAAEDVFARIFAKLDQRKTS